MQNGKNADEQARKRKKKKLKSRLFICLCYLFITAVCTVTQRRRVTMCWLESNQLVDLHLYFLLFLRSLICYNRVEPLKKVKKSSENRTLISSYVHISSFFFFFPFFYRIPYNFLFRCWQFFDFHFACCQIRIQFIYIFYATVRNR